MALAPSPFVELNRAIAIGEVQGPQAALSLLERVDLSEHHLYHSTRAELLRRLGRVADAAAAYEAAIDRAENAAEREFLKGRLEAVNR